jgi:hypothetical protein
MTTVTLPRQFSWSILIRSVVALLAPPRGLAQILQEPKPRKPVERTLSAREARPSRVPAGAGQYLRFELQPYGVEFTARLLSPVGRCCILIR